MDRAEAALRVAEQALAVAVEVRRLMAEIKEIKGEKGDAGPKGDKGDRGEKGADGIVSAESHADVHKGIWKPGEYERGSYVTFAGSQFLSRVKTTDKPETSSAWVLVVKRGRDGKDGHNGKDGAPGPRGPMGHYKGVD